MPSNTPGTIEGGETAALQGAVVERAVVRFTARIASKLRTQIEGVDCMEEQDEGGQPMVWLLLKALYGLKQSGNCWMMLLIKVLKKLGMKQSMADTSLWYRMDRMMVLFFYSHRRRQGSLQRPGDARRAAGQPACRGNDGRGN